MKTASATASTLVMLAMAGSLQAQTIWRCADGYSQKPCPGGKAVEAAPPTPSAAERAQAQSNARRDAQLAGAMEKERLRLEAQAPSAYIPPPRMEPAPEPHKWPEKAGTRKLDVFTAVAPGSKTAQPPAAKAKAKEKKTAKPVAPATPSSAAKS